MATAVPVLLVEGGVERDAAGADHDGVEIERRAVAVGRDAVTGPSDAVGAGDGGGEGGAVGGIDVKAAIGEVDVREPVFVGHRDAVADAGVQPTC